MKANKHAHRQAKASIEANDNERDFGLVLAMSARRRQASQAGKLRAIYKQSPAQYFMRFQDFQKPSARNRILRENGKDPIFTPFDPTPAKQRKQKRPQ